MNTLPPPKKPPEAAPLPTIEESIARVVRDELRKLNVRSRRMVPRDEAAAYLHCSEGTIDNLVLQGKLHPSRYTRWPMFDIDELDRLIEEGKAS